MYVQPSKRSLTFGQLLTPLDNFQHLRDAVEMLRIAPLPDVPPANDALNYEKPILSVVESFKIVFPE